MNSSNIIERFSSSAESWHEITSRVVSIADNQKEIKSFIADGRFIPGGQILRGAGKKESVLYNCFVAPINEKESKTAIANRISSWTKLGCGVGVNVSDWVRNNQKGEKNPLRSIVREICLSQQVLWDEGTTRTATMVNVDIDKVDISEVVESSLEISKVPEFRHVNIGVLFSDKMLIKAKSKETSEYNIVIRICETIWKCGNPSIIFIDTVNNDHPICTEKIEACNPCAEQFLLPNEGCCIGSINLSKFVNEDTFNFESFSICVNEAVRFLDKVIDSSSFPNSESRNLALSRRRIGLGVMGFDTMLNKLKIDYNSSLATDIATDISKCFGYQAKLASEQLASINNNFKDYDKTTIPLGRRNLYLTSIAPTGAISMIFQNSSGIEPTFAESIRLVGS